jgi:UDP-glucose 4-epimerase
MGQTNEIGADVVPCPKSHYGRSKYEAERGILALVDGAGGAVGTVGAADAVGAVGAVGSVGVFAVRIVRAPMVYGENCPGNYRSLRKLALNMGQRGWRLAPTIENQRSMIYIGNLCEFIRQIIDGDEDKWSNSGQKRQDLPTGSPYVYCPQDSKYHCTAELMDRIAAAHGRPKKRGMALSRLLALGIVTLAPAVPPLRKAFGNLTYARELYVIPQTAYCLWTEREAVERTEELTRI